MLGAQAIILILCIVYFAVSIAVFFRRLVDAPVTWEDSFPHAKRLAYQVLLAVGTMYVLTMAGTFDVVCNGPPFKNSAPEAPETQLAPTPPAER